MQGKEGCENAGMEINEALSALQGRESFALAQGREDLLDEIDAEQDAMQRGGNHIGDA